MSLYVKDDIELLSKNIDTINEKIERKQLQMYEPFFKEQEILVWKRSQRQFTATRTPTIYSQIGFPNTYNQSSFGV